MLKANSAFPAAPAVADTNPSHCKEQHKHLLQLYFVKCNQNSIFKETLEGGMEGRRDGGMEGDSQQCLNHRGFPRISWAGLGWGWMDEISSLNLRNRNNLPPLGLGTPRGDRQGGDVPSHSTFVTLTPLSCVCSALLPPPLKKPPLAQWELRAAPQAPNEVLIKDLY